LRWRSSFPVAADHRAGGVPRVGGADGEIGVPVAVEVVEAGDVPAEPPAA